MEHGSEEHLRLLSVARGERPPDLLIRSGTVANIYPGEFLTADVGTREVEAGDTGHGRFR